MSRARATDPVASFDVERVRADFPILHQQVNGRPLVYLDNAASAQKPTAVLDAVRRFDETTYSNIHRGVHCSPSARRTPSSRRGARRSASSTRPIRTRSSSCAARPKR